MRIGQALPIRKPIPLTPLIDVVFLLLMFFMLSSTFAKFGTIDSGASRSGAAEGATPVAAKRTFPGAIIMVTGPGDILVNGKAVARNQFVQTLDGFWAKGVTLAAIRAAKSATVQDLVSTLELARQSRVSRILVMP